MSYDMIMQKLSQIVALSISGLLYFMNQIDVTVFAKLFDKSLALGFLCVAVYLIWKEWKSAEKYNAERDKQLEQLIENNTRAMNRFADEIKNIHGRIDSNERRIDRFDK